MRVIYKCCRDDEVILFYFIPLPLSNTVEDMGSECTLSDIHGTSTHNNRTSFSFLSLPATDRGRESTVPDQLNPQQGQTVGEAVGQEGPNGNHSPGLSTYGWRDGVHSRQVGGVEGDMGQMEGRGHRAIQPGVIQDGLH